MRLSTLFFFTSSLSWVGQASEDVVLGAAAGGAWGFCWRRGESALTTMLMLGLNSDSYCTQRAATAASCIPQKMKHSVFKFVSSCFLASDRVREGACTRKGEKRGRPWRRLSGDTRPSTLGQYIASLYPQSNEVSPVSTEGSSNQSE